MRVATNGTKLRARPPSSTNQSSRPSTSTMNRKIAAAIATHAPRDIVNRQATHMKNIPGPVFGFVGALQTCIQYDYVEYAAKARPDWSFVWIGKEKPGVELSGLRALKNVHFLGIKPNPELPRYLAHFDACLNLFAAGELSKDVSPLKFYEYLATGKPIVSTRQPDQIVQYAPLIEIADSPEGFVAACENALNEDPARAALRMDSFRRAVRSCFAPQPEK